IEKLQKQIKDEKLTSSAMVQTRYAKHIGFDALPITEIASNVGGAAGLAGSDGKDDKDAKKDESKSEEPKKKGGNPLSSLAKGGLTGGKQAQNNQTIASAGARGGFPDRDAKGGPNKSKLTITVTPTELADFKKGIVA